MPNAQGRRGDSAVSINEPEVTDLPGSIDLVHFGFSCSRTVRRLLFLLVSTSLPLSFLVECLAPICHKLSAPTAL